MGFFRRIFGSSEEKEEPQQDAFPGNRPPPEPPQQAQRPQQPQQRPQQRAVVVYMNGRPLVMADGYDGRGLAEAATMFLQQQHRVQRRSVATLNPDRMPKFPYKGSRGETCTVCMCEYEEGEMVRLLPCLHRYHCECVDPWLQDHETCPVCQQDLRRLLDLGDEV